MRRFVGTPLLIGALYTFHSALAVPPPPDVLTMVQEQKTAAGNPSLEPILLWNDTNTKNIVLLHGLFEDPSSMAQLAETYAADGYNVFVPLLPFHGDDLIGMDNMDPHTYANFLDRIVGSFSSAHQQLQLGGFSISGLALSDFIGRHQDNWPRAVTHIEVYSPYLGNNPGIEDRQAFFTRGAEVTLERKHAVSHEEALRRGRTLMERNLAAVETMRANAIKADDLPFGVSFSMYVNPDDRITNPPAEREFFMRLAGPKELVELDTGITHGKVPYSPSLVQRVRNKLSTLKAQRLKCARITQNLMRFKNKIPGKRR